jgi:haloalkane dehalogenase
MMTSLQSATARVGENDFVYRETGEGDPVLYLHGFPTSGYLWRQVMVPVSSNYRTIAPDMPGFGESPLMDRAHTWENLIEWVDAFVDSMKIAPVHLGVHDWGGLIGLAWACIHPEKVRSLLITNTSFRAKDEWHGLAQQWREPEVGDELIGGMTEEGFKSLLSATGNMGEESMDEYWKGLSTLERRTAKLEMYRSLEFKMFEPLEPKLPEVAAKGARVVWGGADPLLHSKFALRFGDRLGAEVTILQDVGHFLQEERGEELGKIHADFLNSLA